MPVRKLFMAIMASVFTLPASAATVKTKHVSNSSGFDNEWENTTTYKQNNVKIGIMIYGFDKDWINEDYVWTKGDECNTTAAIKRDGYDTVYKSGSSAGIGKYSKIEINHKTYNVYYKITFSATYVGTITESTVASHVKG